MNKKSVACLFFGSFLMIYGSYYVHVCIDNYRKLTKFLEENTKDGHRIKAVDAEWKGDLTTAVCCLVCAFWMLLYALCSATNFKDYNRIRARRDPGPYRVSREAEETLNLVYRRPQPEDSENELS